MTSDFILYSKVIVPYILRNLRKGTTKWGLSLNRYRLVNLLRILNGYQQFSTSQMSIINKPSTLPESINGHKTENVTDVVIPVPWGHLSGKWWGPKGNQPIVALHGRQDNAGTFDNLIPLLSDEISVLCLDMPGHGLSSHYPKGQFYSVYWDGIILLRRIAKHFKWKKVKLLGHSLGGAISFLYAASYPDEVDFVISLDIASPSVRDVTKTPAETSDLIDKFLKYESMESDSIPSYTYEEVLDIVEAAYAGSITKEDAATLMKRGLRPSPDPERFYFSRDPRLKVSSMAVFSMDLALAYAARIKCNYLNIRAVPGMKLANPESYGQILDRIKTSARKFVYHEVEGTHHVHLNNPEKLAPIINDFLST